MPYKEPLRRALSACCLSGGSTRQESLEPSDEPRALPESLDGAACKALAVLAVLLQQPSICTDHVTVCKLLCCSKSLREAVCEACSGRVPISYSPSNLQRAQQLATWLPEHGHLAKSLQPTGSIIGRARRPEPTAAEAAIAAGLGSAAAAGVPIALRLQSYKSMAGASDGAILQHLPSSFLTSLDLCLTEHLADSSSSALARLTSLQGLRLDNDSSDITRLLPALSALTQLTSLYLGSVNSWDSLQHLPAQLLELRIDYLHAGQSRLQLEHLTALTKLSIWSFRFSSGQNLQASDVLPPALLSLEMPRCTTAKLLQPLRRLQQLWLRTNSIPAAELFQLHSHLTNLQQVQLSYDGSIGSRTAGAAAAAWHVFPLRELGIDRGHVAAATVQRIGSLTSLTSLTLHGCTPIQATPQELAAQLKQLSGLQQLFLEHLDLLPGEEAGAACAGQGMWALLVAAVGLPQLTVLWFKGMQLAQPHPGDAAELSAAAGLKQLVLSGCGVSDEMLTAIVNAGSMRGLRHLDVTNNSSITDAVLPVIVRVLPQLCGLSLHGTAVTAAGVQDSFSSMKSVHVRR